MLEKNLVVKKSTLPGAGKGLFTKVNISKGTRIVEYKGRRVKWSEVKDDEGKNRYLFFINNRNVIDAEPKENALARYANDARGLSRVEGVRNNATYVIDGKKVFIEATRKISAGSEIFVDYGKDYWKVVKENIAIDERRKKLKQKKLKK